MVIMSIILAYCIGSISTSTLVAKWVGHIDIRQHGSGNAGATNTVRVLGIKWGVFVLLIDVLKGIVAVCIAWSLGGGDVWTTYLSATAVIVGHNWPIFFQFRGGKGIATTIGVLLLLLFKPAIFAGIIALILIAVTRYISLGSLSFTVLTFVFCLLFREPISAIVFSGFIALMSIYRHRTNISRLIRGQEHKILSRKS